MNWDLYGVGEEVILVTNNYALTSVDCTNYILANPVLANPILHILEMLKLRFLTEKICLLS